jgi:hypothetical protein
MKSKEVIDLVEEVGKPSVGSIDTGIGAVADLAYTINRFKVLMFLQRSKQAEVVDFVLDRKKIEEAAEILALRDGEDSKRKEILKLLGQEERAENEVFGNEVLGMSDVLGLQKDKKGKDRLNEVWLVEVNGQKKSVEDWLFELQGKPSLDVDDKNLVDKLKNGSRGGEG